MRRPALALKSTNCGRVALIPHSCYIHLLPVRCVFLFWFAIEPSTHSQYICIISDIFYIFSSNMLVIPKLYHHVVAADTFSAPTHHAANNLVTAFSCPNRLAPLDGWVSLDNGTTIIFVFILESKHFSRHFLSLSCHNFGKRRTTFQQCLQIIHARTSSILIRLIATSVPDV